MLLGVAGHCMGSVPCDEHLLLCEISSQDQSQRTNSTKVSIAFLSTDFLAEAASQ